MRFLVDECTGPAVARWLRSQGYEDFSVYEEARGQGDETLIRKAYEEGWILITNDKDFGEKIYREGYPHHGVILLRLADERAHVKIDRVSQKFAAESQGKFARPVCGGYGNKGAIRTQVE